MYRAAEDGRRCSKPLNRYTPNATGHRLSYQELASPFWKRLNAPASGRTRQRYHDAIEDLEYEGAIEWDKSARYARGKQALPHHRERPGGYLGRRTRGSLLRKQPGRRR